MTLNIFTFQALDDLVDSYHGYGSLPDFKYHPRDIGPLLELEHSIKSQLIPPEAREYVMSSARNPVLLGESSYWISSSAQYAMMLLNEDELIDESQLDTFTYNVRQSAYKHTSLDKITSSHLGAFVDEMVSNVREHSGSISTGSIAFAARPRSFEIVVSDRGRGILKSLKENAAHAHLKTEGQAMFEALKEGTSRIPRSDHGLGFRPMLLGVARLHSSIRMRSGDAALVMSGTAVAPIESQISNKQPSQGFLISVKCSGSKLCGET